MILVVCLNWDSWDWRGILGIRGWLFGVLCWGRWWRGESFWRLPSPRPRPGPLPLGETIGLLVVDGGLSSIPSKTLRISGDFRMSETGEVLEPPPSYAGASLYHPREGCTLRFMVRCIWADTFTNGPGSAPGA